MRNYLYEIGFEVSTLCHVEDEASVGGEASKDGVVSINQMHAALNVSQDEESSPATGTLCLNLLHEQGQYQSEETPKIVLKTALARPSGKNNDIKLLIKTISFG